MKLAPGITVDGRYRLEVSGERLPVLFTLIATRLA